MHQQGHADKDIRHQQRSEAIVIVSVKDTINFHIFGDNGPEVTDLENKDENKYRDENDKWEARMSCYDSFLARIQNRKIQHKGGNERIDEPVEKNIKVTDEIFVLRASGPDDHHFNRRYHTGRKKNTRSPIAGFGLVNVNTHAPKDHAQKQ